MRKTTCFARAQIRHILLFVVVRRVVPYFYQVTHCSARLFSLVIFCFETMAKAKSKTINKKSVYARQQKLAQKEEVETWALKLIQWRENKKQKKLSNKESYGSFYDDSGFRVALGNSSHLTWNKVNSKAVRMAKKMEAEKAASSVVLEVQEVAAKKPPGRPIGSTNEAAADLKDRKMKAIILLTERYDTAQQSTDKKLAPGTYKKLHDEVIKKFDLEETGFTIKYNTIKSCIARGTTRTTRGRESPTLALEPFLITFANYRQDAGQPMKKEEVIELANEMLKGSVIENVVINLHKENKRNPEQLLGLTWYNLFLKHNKEILKTGCGTHQHHSRKV